MRDNNIYMLDYDAKLEAEGITPAMEMEDVINLLEEEEDTKENAEALKYIHEQALQGETEIKVKVKGKGKGKRKKYGLRLMIIHEACKLMKKDGTPYNMLPRKSISWCYLELVTIAHRMLDGVAYN